MELFGVVGGAAGSLLGYLIPFLIVLTVVVFCHETSSPFRRVADGALSFSFTHMRQRLDFEEENEANADDQPADPQAAHRAALPDQGSGAESFAAETRRLHARLHDDPEEAELGASQGREGASHQRF